MFQKHKERLDQFHRHAVLSAVWKENHFSVFSLIDIYGRKILGISLSNPFEKNLSLYSTSNVDFLLSEIFSKLFDQQPQFQKSAVIKLPFQSKAIAVVGEDEFLEKEIFKEKIHSLSFFTFASKINEELYEKFRRWNGKKVDFAQIHLFDDFATCVITIPKSAPLDHASLLAEIARVYRPMYGQAYQGNVKRFGNSPILTIFTVDYNQLLEGLDLEAKCSQMCSKILKAYDCVISLLKT